MTTTMIRLILSTMLLAAVCGPVVAADDHEHAWTCSIGMPDGYDEAGADKVQGDGYEILFSLNTCDLPIPIYYYGADAPSSTLCDFDALIQEAIDTWNDISTIGDLMYLAGPADDGDILWETKNLVNQLIWDGYEIPAGTTLMWPTAGTDDKEIDVRITNVNVDCTGLADRYDYLTILIHELGHVLGFDHNDEVGSVMTGFIYEGMVMHDLGSVDINGIEEIYNQSPLDDELLIDDVVVTTAYQAATHTWDAAFTFSSNLSGTSTVTCIPADDCFGPKSYSATGDEAIDHVVTVTGLPASTTFDFEVDVRTSSQLQPCTPTETGQFTVDGALDPIHDIVVTPNARFCRLGVQWTTEFLSEDNVLFYRRLGTTPWQSTLPVQRDCLTSRTYSASFGVQANVVYEFYVESTMGGQTYQSAIATDKVKICMGGGKNLSSLAPSLSSRISGSQVSLDFNISRGGDVELAIYSLRGERVAVLVSDALDSGAHMAVWNGVTDRGVRAPAGVYLARLRSADGVLSSKVTFLR